MPQSSGYVVAVNVYDGGGAGTGHVNITLIGPGWSQTFGNNVNGGSWGVRTENDFLTRSDIHTTYYDVTYSQIMDMYNWSAGIISDPQNSYGLLGRNCVDFVRDMFSVGSLGNQISSAMQWVGAPVNQYAEIGDWVQRNGFGETWETIGGVVGAFGELGSLTLNAASRAWDYATGLPDAAWQFINDLGSWAGGFTGSLLDDIRGFFGRFFGTDFPDVETPGGHTRGSGWEDDALLDFASVAILAESDSVTDDFKVSSWEGIDFPWLGSQEKPVSCPMIHDTLFDLQTISLRIPGPEESWAVI